MTWMHAFIAANITIVFINMFCMMFAPDFPGRFRNGFEFAAFMGGVWFCAIIAWHMATA